VHKGIYGLGEYKGQGGDGAAAHNGEEGPAKEKGEEVAVDQPQVFIKAAGPGGHGGETGIGKGAENADDPGDDPGEQDPGGVMEVLRHGDNLFESAGADHDARHQQCGGGEPKDALKFAHLLNIS
jgi:hypothetical protein